MRINVLARIVVAAAVAIGVANVGLGSSALRWKLNIHPDDTTQRNPAGRIAVKPAKGREQVYWYCVYTIKNTHDEAIPLSVNVTAETDASDAKFNEGYYPRAVAQLKKKFGDDLMDNLSLNGFSLEPGKTVRAVAVFQFYEPGPGMRFEERVNHITMKFGGYCDPVKRAGLQYTLENIQLWMEFSKKGDQFDPGHEPVNFLRQEEHVIAGG